MVAFSLKSACSVKLHYALVDEVDSILIDEARNAADYFPARRKIALKCTKVNKIIPHLIRQEKEDSDTFRMKRHSPLMKARQLT